MLELNPAKPSRLLIDGSGGGCWLTPHGEDTATSANLFPVGSFLLSWLTPSPEMKRLFQTCRPTSSAPGFQCH